MNYLVTKEQLMKEDAGAIAQQIAEFLKEPGTRSWCETPRAAVYVRNSLLRRYTYPNEDILDLASISVDAEYQGRGFLTALLDALEPRHSIYVESILDPKLRDFLAERGYSKGITATDMYKRKKL